MEVSHVHVSTGFLGAALAAFGALLVWVRFAHDRNAIAGAIYRMYEKTQFVAFPLEAFFLAGGIGLLVLGALLFSGLIQ
jgi:hypothetical protein